MGRKPKELTEEQTAQVEALAADWSGMGPIVYGLAGADGVIVYVGATRNPSSRFACYRSNKNCHNERLSAWLVNSDCFVHVLHKGLDGLFEAEKSQIKARSGLFNLIGGGEQNWRDHAQKPWMAGTGALCPSAIALRKMKIDGYPCHNAHKQILDRRKSKMSDHERALFEVRLAMGMPFCNRIKKWLDIAGPRLVRFLEAT
jgi:hypothetical protein